MFNTNLRNIHQIIRKRYLLLVTRSFFGLASDWYPVIQVEAPEEEGDDEGLDPVEVCSAIVLDFIVTWLLSPDQWCHNHGISTSLRLRMMMLVFRLKRFFSVRRREAASRGGSRSSAIMSIVLDLSQRDETWSCSFSLESSLQQKYLTTS